MAQQILVRLIDDLDGGDATETVTFGLDGVAYEIDLNHANARTLRAELERYIVAGRRTSRRPTRSSSTGAAGSTSTLAATRELNQAVRAWATENGFAVSSRGRIPAAVLAAYQNRDQPSPAPVKRTAATRRNPTPAAQTETPVSPRERSAAIRAWAAENGFSVSARGRIPAAVLTAYQRQDQNRVPAVKRPAAARKPTAAATRKPGRNRPATRG